MMEKVEKNLVEKNIDTKLIENVTSGNVVGFTPDAGCGNPRRLSINSTKLNININK